MMYCAKTRLSYNTVRCSTKKSCSPVARSSKTPQELREMMHIAINNASDFCNDQTNDDKECLVMWDVVVDISKAYSKAIEENKFMKHDKNMEKSVTHILVPRTYIKKK